VLAVDVDTSDGCLIPQALFFYAVLWRSAVAFTIWACIAATVLLPAQTHWQGFLDSYVFATWRTYFSFSTVFDTTLTTDRKYIFAELPHVCFACGRFVVDTVWVWMCGSVCVGDEGGLRLGVFVARVCVCVCACVTGVLWCQGVFPFGPILAGTIVSRLFRDLKVYAISASNVFLVPGIKHMFAWMGAMPATRKNFERLLARNGAACAVIVDGLAGMYVQDPAVENVVLKTRRGFIKVGVCLSVCVCVCLCLCVRVWYMVPLHSPLCVSLLLTYDETCTTQVALSQGADLVPVYHFGNTRVLSIIGKALKRVSRALRFSFLIQYGRFGLPIPRRVPIMMAVGKPIPVKKMELVKGDPESEKAYNEEVERLHKLFVEGLVGLFHKYKAQYDESWADLPIKIVR